MYHIIRKFVLKHRVHEASELGVETLISGNEFVGEGESRHEASLLEPIDGAKTSAEKNAFDAGEGAESFSKTVFSVHPCDGPFCFLLDGRNGVDGLEKVRLFDRIFDVGVDQERVGLGVYIFHGLLESVKRAGFGDLNLGVEVER